MYNICTNNTYLILLCIKYYYTCMHTYIHTHIHTYIQMYIIYGMGVWFN
jgi:hypothetical protein